MQLNIIKHFFKQFVFFFFFFFLYLASLYNFADDNTSPSFAKSIDILVKILESKSDFAKAWFCFVKKLNLEEIYIIKQSNWISE